MALNQDIDKEWENFISSNNDDDDISSDGEEVNEILQQTAEEFISANLSADLDSEAPKSTNIYISTKTKIAYLNTEINLKDIFWKVPIIPYATPTNGVIKKQMKFNSITQEELDEVHTNLKTVNHYEDQVMTSINNPSGRIKFKDIRKVSIGISKKDIMSYRSKKKSAFYNCFVMILRIRIQDLFKEFHIKVFNTGKMEIPGIQNETIFEIVLNNIISTLQPYMDKPIGFEVKSDTVLINSNFNCGFYINRETLYDILKTRYNIQCIYDPCSYPGIQCKFYYNPALEVQTGSQISEEEKSTYKNIVTVSFMIFRTGSILIVGMCDENVLHIIYEFLKVMLEKEFHQINQKIITPENTVVKNKKKKIRKKNIVVSV